jgi:hypothetical protein
MATKNTRNAKAECCHQPIVRHPERSEATVVTKRVSFPNAWFLRFAQNEVVKIIFVFFVFFVAKTLGIMVCAAA